MIPDREGNPVTSPRASPNSSRWFARSEDSVRTWLASVLLVAAVLGSVRHCHAQQSHKTICVLVDRAWTDDSLLRGLRRPFLLRNLPLERESPKERWKNAGSIHNIFHLAASSCVDQGWADSVKAITLTGDPSEDSGKAVDYVARVRIKGWSQMIVDYVARPGDPTPRPNDEIHPTGVTVEVAVCAPESLKSSLEWTPMKVWWREKPRSPSREGEIHGWIVGMAALQILHRRLGLLPDSLDLVFESRGRNR